MTKFHPLLIDFRIGDRVEVHPATDRWMMGDRYGSVVAIGRTYLTVRLDSGVKQRILPTLVMGVVS